jgi:hypothetical protein
MRLSTEGTGARVQIDRESPGVQGERPTGSDAPRRVAAGEPDVLLERAGLVEAAGVHGVVAGVPDPLLGRLARAVLPGVELARADALGADLVVEQGEVDVERLGGRPPTRDFT